jgi:hypothetical protein
VSDDFAYVADRVAYAIGRVGEPGVLVRLPGRTGTRQELPLKCVPTYATPTAPAGSVVQAHLEVRIGNAELAASNWPGPIRRGDQIIIAGITYTVQGVQTSSPNGHSAMHLLYVLGPA